MKHRPHHSSGSSRNPGQTCRTRTPEQVHNHRLGLIVEGVAREQHLAGIEGPEQGVISLLACFALE
jgi:hypothetical protein